MSYGICKYCGANIRWVKTMASGKNMPINPEPDKMGNLIMVCGEIVVVTDRFRIEHHDDGDFFYISHFATCPGADAHF